MLVPLEMWELIELLLVVLGRMKGKVFFLCFRLSAVTKECAIRERVLSWLEA